MKKTSEYDKLVNSIYDIKKQDKAAFIMIAIGIILTSLVWICDIASFAWLGNGFIIDFLLLTLAIILTIVTTYFWFRLKDKREKVVLETSENQKSIIDDEGEKVAFTCFNCGEIIIEKDGLCPSCGSPKPVCAVCFSELTRNDEVVKLSCCSLYAHKQHIFNYLEIKGQCPKCQQELSKEDLEEVHF